jgi:hypothetical protein
MQYSLFARAACCNQFAAATIRPLDVSVSLIKAQSGSFFLNAPCIIALQLFLIKLDAHGRTR